MALKRMADVTMNFLLFPPGFFSFLSSSGENPVQHLTRLEHEEEEK
jgi:hypothetical protein